MVDPEGRICGRRRCRNRRTAGVCRRAWARAVRAADRARSGQAARRQARHRVRSRARSRRAQHSQQHVRDGMAATQRQAADLPGGRPCRMVHARRGSEENQRRTTPAARSAGAAGRRRIGTDATTAVSRKGLLLRLDVRRRHDLGKFLLVGTTDPKIMNNGRAGFRNRGCMPAFRDAQVRAATKTKPRKQPHAQ